MDNLKESLGISRDNQRDISGQSERSTVMADERRSASSSSHYSSKTDSTICQLKLDLTNLREKYGELRRNAEREWCRRENELRRKFQTKLESTREKWRIEKNREFENALTQAKRDYEQRLTTALQIKEKELRLKCHQNNPTPTTTTTNKKTLDVSTSSPYHSQDVSCALKISGKKFSVKKNEVFSFVLVGTISVSL